jgi:methionyl-tRNA formyltransferase
MLKKEDGQLDFTQPAEALARRVRAFNPWPGTYTLWEGQILKVHQAYVVGAGERKENASEPAPTPGARLVHQGLPAIATANGLLVLDEVQPAGKKLMPGKVFLQGAKNWDKKN